MSNDDTLFDARWYRAAYPDVDILGMEPAEHYRLIGQPLGRRPCPESQPPRPLADLAAGVAAFPRSTGVAGKAVPVGTGPEPFQIIDSPFETLQEPLHQVPLMGDQSRYIPLAVRLGGAEVAGAADEASLARFWPVLATFCQLHGLDPAKTCHVVPEVGVTLSGPLPRPETPATAAGRSSESLRGLADLWFASSHDLVLSFGAEGCDDGVVARLFQIDGRKSHAAVLVGEQVLAPQGPSFLEAALRNPLMPLLLELADASGKTIDLGLLPFPSLVRGGLHAAEIAALTEGDGSVETLWLYGAARLREWFASGRQSNLAHLAVSLEEATGAEPIFSSVIDEWLSLHGLRVEAADTSQPGDRSRLGSILPSSGGAAGPDPAPGPGREGPTLLLPADALPTVAALTRPLAGPHSGGAELAPFVVAERGSNRPLWSVTLPSQMEGLRALQPNAWHPPMLLGGNASGLPMAVVHRDARTRGNLELLMPSLPERLALPSPASTGTRDAPWSVTCALTVTDPEAALSFLETLAGQTGSENVRVAMSASPGDAEALGEHLDRLFPRRHCQLERTRALDASHLLDAADGQALLLAEDRTLLYDPRTLQTFRAMLASGSVASAACVTLHEEAAGKSTIVRNESGGYFPSRISFVGGPHLVFDLPDILAALPHATYPVAANAFSAALISPGALAAAGPRLAVWCGNGAASALDPLAFGLAALAEGWQHLCTSVVRAATVRPRRRADRTEPALSRVVAPARWEDLLNRVTVVRELR